jgi:hypothetical protein
LLAELIDPNNTAGDVWADTAYRSQANEKFLAGRLLRSQIHRKKPKSLPRRRPGANQCRAAPPGPMPASASWMRLSRTVSGMRFQTRSGRGERSFKASGPPLLCRSYQR